MKQGFQNFKEHRYKPYTPFTQDQVAYLEDKFTSLMSWFAYEEKSAGKLKEALAEILQEIRKAPKK